MRKELTTDQIKKVKISLLLDFDRFCKENLLQYNLAGETLLGAVRYRGYVPWNDDIDVLMARPDYDKMLYLSRYKKMQKYVRIICGDNGTFQNPYARFEDVRTTCTEKYNCGHLGINIYPVDGLPRDYGKCSRIYTVAHVLKSFNILAGGQLSEKKPLLKYYFRKTAAPLFSVIGTEKICRMLEKLGRRYSYGKYRYVGCVSWGARVDGERMKKDDYEYSVTVEFEGFKFPAMFCWDQYLSGLYGDYMKKPMPENIPEQLPVWIDYPDEIVKENFVSEQHPTEKRCF